MSYLTLSATGVKCFVGARQLFDLQNAQIYKGDRIGIVGVNGAGKTTLMRTLAGLAEPDEGAVDIRGTTFFMPQTDSPDAAYLGDNVGFSGGERVRARMAAAMAARPDTLMLDEPASHLDDETREVLLRFLRKFSGAALIISHDRRILDELCDEIWEIDGGRVIKWPGGYRAYEEGKRQKFQKDTDAYDAYIEERARLIRAADAQHAMAEKFQNASENDFYRGKGRLVEKRAQAMRARVERLVKVERPRAIGRARVDFSADSQPVSKFPLRVENLTLAPYGRKLLENASFCVGLGEKVAVTGRNGCGKSALFGHIEARGDGVFVAPSARIGYFSQRLDSLDDSKTLLENVMSTSSQSVATARLNMSRLWIKGEDVNKKAGLLSGGERVKGCLAKLYMSDANFLLLDEPTNFLDVFATRALEEALIDYPGSILMVCHDRTLRERVCSRELDLFSGYATDYVV